MDRWEKLRQGIADIFKPCYVPGQSDFEKSAIRASSPVSDQTLTEGITGDSKPEGDLASDPLIKHSYFPDIPSNQDLLGFKSYADTLANLIADPKTQTPLTIGIFGSWGSGKSTLMNMIQSELDQKSRTAKQRFVLIPFNAWKYGREDVLHRAIILRVLDSLRPADDPSKDLINHPNCTSDISLSKQIERLEQRLYRDVEWEEKSRLTIDWPKLVKGGAGGAIKLSYSFLPGLSGLTEAVKSAQGAFGKGDVASDTATLFEAFQRDVVKHHQVQLRYVEQFQEQFDNLISTYLPNERIVIFVDDLDRCLPEKTIEVLEAIKLFMDVKRCVFVLGLDQQIISRAIQHRYKDLQPEEKKKLAFDGVRYLEKIVQLPFMLPSIEVSDMHNYVESLNADWPETPPETSCAAILAESLPSNPRQVKRTINVFLLLWKLAESRRDKIGDAVTPLRLVKVVVLQTAYPALFEELKAKPLVLLQLEAFCVDSIEKQQQENIITEAPLQTEDTASAIVQLEISKYDLPTIQDLLQRTSAPESELRCLFLFFYEHELARFAELSENQLRAFFSLAGRLPTEAELSPSSVEVSKPVAIPNNIPRSGVATFVGRNSELRQLHQLLQQKDRIALAAITGLGGIGKTELALQYCLTYQQNYPGGVCWLQAKETDVGMQILNFARAQLGITPPQELELIQQVVFCWRNWPEGDVLVVLDDLSDYEVIQPYLPPSSPRFKVLVTSRLQLGPPFKQFSVDVLTPETALELLRSLIGQQRLTQQLQDAEDLCKWLGYLPLGLDLVGRYLARKPDLSLKRMQERLSSQGLEDGALSSPERGMTADQGIKSIAAAFELGWQELTEPERQLACILSLFALTPIPWELVETQFDDVDEEDLEDWRDTGLVSRSLLQWFGEGTYQLHQLIREFFRAKLEASQSSADLKHRYAQTMVQQAQEIPPTPTRDQVLAFAPIVPHLAEAATTLQDWLTDDDLIWPFVGLARFYEGQGAYAQAEPWYELCLGVTRSRLGAEHPDVATSLNNLAALYRAQGRYEEAEPLYREALQLSRELLGDRHPQVATSLNNLAGLYRVQGRYEEAEPLYREALQLSRELLGDRHPHVATSLNNLALLYDSQGRYGEAEPLYAEALELIRRVLGEEHPDVARSLNNLASLYVAQGRYSEAEPLYRQALELYQGLLGEEHPAVASSLNNLAGLYRVQGRYSDAEPLYRQALDLGRRLLGEEHPDVATSLNNLALLYDDQGRYQDSEPLYLQSLELRKRLLGEQHPVVAASLNNLAYSYAAKGKKEEASSLYQQALKIAEEQLGPKHPTTVAIRKNIAAL